MSHQRRVGESGQRSARLQIERQLQHQQVADSRRLAEVLLECGLSPSDGRTVECLSHPGALSFLEHVAALKATWEITSASVQKIARIVRALRYYSRSGEGEMFDIDINESLDNTVVILQNRIKHVAAVERNYEEALPTVRCGPDISQVWTNILSNACDAIEGSGVQKGGLIRILTRAHDHQVSVEIFNRGNPIAEELLPKIFDPFFTTKPIGKGTGLGLSICVGILRKYGGTIAARNDADGVTFRVELPLLQAEDASSRQPPAEASDKGAVSGASGGGG